MNKLEAMRTFVQVAEAGSFVSASRALQMSASAVTRSVSELEESLGVTLLIRSTRYVRLTDSGQRYLRDAKRILEDINEAEAIVGGSTEPRGELAVTAPVLFGQLHVVPVVAEYMAQHADVTVNLMLFDRVAALGDENIDVAVRIGAQQSEEDAHCVGFVKRVICASPDYLNRAGTPETPHDIFNHQTVIATSQAHEWRFQNGEVVKLRPRLCANDNATAIAAAMEGGGLTRVMSYQVAEHLESGALVRVLEDLEAPALNVCISRPPGQRETRKTAAFIELAVQQLRTSPAIFHDQTA